jgi:hypothetical protein
MVKYIVLYVVIMILGYLALRQSHKYEPVPMLVLALTFVPFLQIVILVTGLGVWLANASRKKNFADITDKLLGGKGGRLK